MERKKKGLGNTTEKNWSWLFLQIDQQKKRNNSNIEKRCCQTEKSIHYYYKQQSFTTPIHYDSAKSVQKLQWARLINPDFTDLCDSAGAVTFNYYQFFFVSLFWYSRRTNHVFVFLHSKVPQKYINN